MLSYVLSALVLAPFVAARFAGILRSPLPCPADVVAVDFLARVILSARPADVRRPVRVVVVLPVPFALVGVAA